MLIPKTKTEILFEGTSCYPYSNSAQGSYKRLLFVCSAGLLRSPTAALVAAKRGYNTRSCGANLNCALIPLNLNLLKWADKVIWVNSEDYKGFKQCCNDPDVLQALEYKSILWSIKDDYDYNDLSLVFEINKLLDKEGLK